MALGWKGRNTFGCHTISTGAYGSSTLLIAVSVRCPLPVAARLPYNVTLKRFASGCRDRNISAAFLGPIVWLLDGPFPMRYISFMVFMIERFFICILMVAKVILCFELKGVK